MKTKNFLIFAVILSVLVYFAVILSVLVYVCSPDSDNANESEVAVKGYGVPENFNPASTNNSPKDYSTYQEACKNNDFDAAHRMLDEKRKEYIDTLASGPVTSLLHKVRDRYYEAFDYIYNNEVQFILLNFNDEECRDKIQFLLADISVIGEKREAGRRSYYGGISDYDIAYQTWAMHFNRLCDKVLTLAINRKYKSTAQMALLQIVDNMNTSYSGNYSYVEYVDTDRKNAKKKYDDAVALGIFTE